MLRTILKATTGLAIGFGIGIASAQSLRNADQPAEFPPASYAGKQYVDSKGCVFVRAGFDGAVSWVPRVSRSRTVLCGFQPTFAGATPEPAPRVADVPAPVPTQRVAAPRPPRQIAVAAPAPAAAPAPRVTAPAPAAAPTPVRTPAPTRVVVAPPQPVRTVVVQPAPVPVAPSVAARPAPRSATACPGASALSQRYLNSGSYSVRCGPQAPVPTAGAVRGVAPSATALHIRPGPKIAPPPGYRAAFADDRFNPNRGLQTREGSAQMRLVWTSGVPRRLVDRNSGRDVTGLFPGLRFPFTNAQQQASYAADRGSPTSGASSGPDIVIATKNTPATAAVAPVRTTAAPVRAKAVPAGHRYVQVGTFGVRANAQNSAARLKAMGLPVRVGTYLKSGKSYSIVLAGPFGSGAQLQAGLTAARRAGFSDAFTRK